MARPTEVTDGLFVPTYKQARQLRRGFTNGDYGAGGCAVDSENAGSIAVRLVGAIIIPKGLTLACLKRKVFDGPRVKANVAQLFCRPTFEVLQHCVIDYHSPEPDEQARQDRDFSVGR
jgi:hypothetical protein